MPPVSLKERLKQFQALKESAQAKSEAAKARDDELRTVALKSDTPKVETETDENTAGEETQTTAGETAASPAPATAAAPAPAEEPEPSAGEEIGMY